MDENRLQEIEAHYSALLLSHPFIGQLRVNDLIAEVRRLRPAAECVEAIAANRMESTASTTPTGMPEFTARTHDPRSSTRKAARSRRRSPLR